ncbi:hypothetical protein BY996DRAFT_6410732 [Phakopsora pachyrhizi]|nr:hypothetical protein BY996DRAFT_6410732 [Phakopsora pachyrhizi]
MIGQGSASGRESGKGRDVAGLTGQEASFHTKNAASGAAIARRVSKNRHWQRPQKEEGLTRVATVAEKLPKAERAGLGRILQGRRRKGLYGDKRIDNRRADKGKNTLQRNKDCSTDKEAVGREEAGGRPE